MESIEALRFKGVCVQAATETPNEIPSALFLLLRGISGATNLLSGLAVLPAAASAPFPLGASCFRTCVTHNKEFSFASTLLKETQDTPEITHRWEIRIRMKASHSLHLYRVAVCRSWSMSLVTIVKEGRDAWEG